MWKHQKNLIIWSFRLWLCQFGLGTSDRWNKILSRHQGAAPHLSKRDFCNFNPSLICAFGKHFRPVFWRLTVGKRQKAAPFLQKKGKIFQKYRKLGLKMHCILFAMVFHRCSLGPDLMSDKTSEYAEFSKNALCIDLVKLTAASSTKGIAYCSALWL